VSTTIVKLVSAESVQKQLEAPGDCQDACCKNPERGRYAIADGVTRSFFPDEWAKLLVEHFCNDGSESNSRLFETKDWQAWVTAIQPKWLAKVQARVKDRTGLVHAHLHNSLAAREPAASTFVGVEIDTNRDGEALWRAILMGDSCLLTCREGRMTSLPIEHSNGFNHHPAHFASYPDAGRRYEPTFQDGKVAAGDVMILATDALAKWFIGQYERDPGQWLALLDNVLQIQKWRDLYRFVEAKRNDPHCPLEDDDTALIVLQGTPVVGKHNPIGSPPIVTAKHFPCAPARELAVPDSPSNQTCQGAVGQPQLVDAQPPVTKPAKSRHWIIAFCASVVAILAVVIMAIAAVLLGQHWLFDQP
jgi:hypothetical protein